MSINRTITEDTEVTVTMKGEQHTFSFGPSAALSSWANTLSDLTGFRADYILSSLLAALPTQYGAEVNTAAGELCPISFLVTVTAKRHAETP